MRCWQSPRIGHVANPVKHMADRVDHELWLLVLYVVAGVRVEDERGVQTLGQLPLTGYVGPEMTGPSPPGLPCVTAADLPRRRADRPLRHRATAHRFTLDPGRTTKRTLIAPCALLDMPTPRAMFYQVGVAGNKIYVMGGADSSLTVSAANEVFNTADNTWSSAEPMPTPRGEMGVGSVGGTIWTVGGAVPAFGISENALETFFVP